MYNKVTNSSNPALQGRHAGESPLNSPVINRVGQMGEAAQTQGQGLEGLAAGGTAAPSPFPGAGGMPQGSVAPGAPANQGAFGTQNQPQMMQSPQQGQPGPAPGAFGPAQFDEEQGQFGDATNPAMGGNVSSVNPAQGNPMAMRTNQGGGGLGMNRGRGFGALAAGARGAFGGR